MIDLDREIAFAYLTIVPTWRKTVEWYVYLRYIQALRDLARQAVEAYLSPSTV